MLLTLTLFAAQAAMPPALTPPAAEPLVCRRAKVTGSRLGGRRRCMTRSQWDAAEAAARQSLQDMREVGAQTQTGRD